MKRVFYLLIMLWAGLAAHAEEEYLTEEYERIAVKNAFNIIKATFPGENEVCVSYKFWHDGPLEFFMIDRKIDDFRKLRRKDQEDKPSEALASLFPDENCDCNDYTFMANFTRPYKNMIGCSVQRIHLFFGSKFDVVDYLFIYSDDGEIKQMCRLKWIY